MNTPQIMTYSDGEELENIKQFTSAIVVNSLTSEQYVTSSNSSINMVVPEFIKIIFQERIKDLYIFCIHKNYSNQYNIDLFEIDGGKITDNLTEIIKTLKKDLSLEEFREYERQIFKYF